MAFLIISNWNELGMSRMLSNAIDESTTTRPLSFLMASNRSSNSCLEPFTSYARFWIAFSLGVYHLGNNYIWFVQRRHRCWTKTVGSVACICRSKLKRTRHEPETSEGRIGLVATFESSNEWYIILSGLGQTEVFVVNMFVDHLSVCWFCGFGKFGVRNFAQKITFKVIRNQPELRVTVM